MPDSSRRHPERGGTRSRQPLVHNIEGSKGSVFYRAHSYHTKVPVEGLIQLVDHYTDPGDVVVDRGRPIKWWAFELSLGDSCRL